jgi:hypothetical protein
LEACSCGVLCPCWIGEDPDGGTCDAFVAYHFDKGEIDGVDVSGLNIVNIVHIPGNVLVPGSWQLVMFLDAAASERQRDAIVAAYSGKLGGPLADLAGLVGEIKAVESVNIEHSIVPGSPAYVGKASYHRVTLPKHGFEWSFEGRNAIQADYTMEFVA